MNSWRGRSNRGKRENLGINNREEIESIVRILTKI